MTEKIKLPSMLTVIFFASLFSAGLFNEYFSCLASVALLLWLVVNHIKKKETVFYSNITSWSIVIIVLSYAICSLWAVDMGVAIIGFFKYLPVVLFLLALMQTNDKEKMLTLLPYVAGVMVIISSAFSSSIIQLSTFTILWLLLWYTPDIILPPRVVPKAACTLQR